MAFKTQVFFMLSRYRQQQELHQMDLFEEAVVSNFIFEKDRIYRQRDAQRYGICPL